MSKVIINEHMARHYFADRDPIGQFVKFSGDRPPVEIIGVVSDVRSVTLRAQRDEYFGPPSVGGWGIVVARPKPGVSIDAVTALMHTAFTEVAKDAVVEIAPLEAAVQKTIGRDRLVARLSVAFAALGMSWRPSAYMRRSRIRSVAGRERSAFASRSAPVCATSCGWC